METGGSLLVVTLEWVYIGSVCVERWYGTLEMDACGRVELRGSVRLVWWCGVLGVKSCDRVELKGSMGSE